MLDSGPKISIVTATYNSKQYLRDTIRSVLGQSYKNIQYIVIDGVSSDGTLDILQQFRQEIDVLVSEPDSGVYDAFNKGIRYAAGDIIYFLNSDDYLLDAGVLLTVAAAFQAHPETMGVYGKIIYRQEDMDLWEPAHFGTIGGAELQRGQLPPHPAFFARREVYQKVGKFDLSYRIDQDALNWLFQKNYLLLPAKYNKIVFRANSEDFRHPAFWHFAGVKPWHNFSSSQDMLYWKALALTPWQDILLDRLSAAVCRTMLKFEEKIQKDQSAYDDLLKKYNTVTARRM